MEEPGVGPAVREIAELHGRPSAAPRLLRSGTNHVYVVDDIVVRVARSDVDVGRDLAIGRMLRETGALVPEPIGSGQLSGYSYSVWEYIEPDESSHVDFHQFGAGIRALHDTDPARVALFDLPWCDESNWLDIDLNLTLAREAQVVPDEDIDLLEAHADRLSSWGDQCRAAPDHVVCHGDVHPENVLMRHGRAVIVNWDTICLGPPQWDHAALLTRAARWGGQPSDYQAFADGYGKTFAADPLATELAEIRLLAPTVNMIVKGRDVDRFAAEARPRMRFWRGEPDPPAWTPQ